MTDFFISYHNADRAWAEWIAWQLEEAGYNTLIQAWDFRPGDNFVLLMQRTTAEADRTITVLSPDYLATRLTQPEWAAAFIQDPTGVKGLLIPIRVRQCDLSSLLPQIVYIDLVGLDEALAKTRLLAGVQRSRAKPHTAPGYPGLTDPNTQRKEIQPLRFPGANIPVPRVPTAEADLERPHREELRRIMQRRLQVLEQQAASYGLSTPQEILIEIEELSRRINRLAYQTSAESAKPDSIDNDLLEDWKHASNSQRYNKGLKKISSEMKDFINRIYGLLNFSVINEDYYINQSIIVCRVKTSTIYLNLPQELLTIWIFTEDGERDHIGQLDDISNRSYWIPGSWYLRMVYTNAIPFHDPSQESNRAG
jgi:hypothetical protein